MKTTPIQTLLVDDHPVVLNGLKSLLGRTKGITISGEAQNGAEALMIMEEKQVDLIISDISMPVMDGIELTGVLKKKYPDIKIMLLTAYNEKEILKKALESGAEACLLKNSSKKELLKAVERIMDGGYYYCDSLINIAKDFQEAPQKKEENVLTERELEILQLLLKGCSSNEMAELLNISYHTVTSHRKNILKKTDCNHISELFTYAQDNNLLP